MSQNRISGLSSSFEAPSSSSEAPSAVSSIASRFEKPASSASAPQVSDRLSGIANRFGATVADTAAVGKKKKKGGPPAAFHKGPKLVGDDDTKDPVVMVERPDFGAISKRFAEGKPAGNKQENSGEQDANVFARARDAFVKIESEAKEPVEGRVCSVARGFDSGDIGKRKEGIKTASRNPDSVLGPAGKIVEEDKVVADKVESVGNIASRFEGVKLADTKLHDQAEDNHMQRFDKAGKLFGSGTAEEKVDVAEEVSSSFADAARLFGGK